MGSRQTVFHPGTDQGPGVCPLWPLPKRSRVYPSQPAPSSEARLTPAPPDVAHQDERSSRVCSALTLTQGSPSSRVWLQAGLRSPFTSTQREEGICFGHHAGPALRSESRCPQLLSVLVPTGPFCESL